MRTLRGSTTRKLVFIATDTPKKGKSDVWSVLKEGRRRKPSGESVEDQWCDQTEKRRSPDYRMEDVFDTNNNKSYSLRPRSSVKKTEEEEDLFVKRKPKRRKSKVAPLSKYRRKTANARERDRMKEINDAFDSLRRCVPYSQEADKLTKISTLRLAMKYIEALSATLAEPKDLCEMPPTPPVSDSPPSPQEINLTDLHDFVPFSEAALDFDDFFFT